MNFDINKAHEEIMNITSITNINFGRIKYEGRFNNKHFGPWDRRPEKYLTSKQNKLSKIIEDSFSKSPNNHLEFRLGCDKKTDIHFVYDNPNEMTVRLLKRINRYESYTPYNNSETSEIKMNFNLKDNLDMNQVRKNIDKFIQECKEYLKCGHNITNNGIEEEIRSRW